MIQLIYIFFINKLLFLFFKFCILYNYIASLVRYFFPSNKAIEPENDNWYCLCQFNGPLHANNYKQTYYTNLFDLTNNYVVSSENLHNTQGTIIYKYKTAGDTASYIVQTSLSDNIIHPEDVEKYKIKQKLIFADYTHPDLNDPISFEHISFYCNEGNVLFTPEFVYRYLCHSVENIESIPFDEKYQIVAMDQDTNVYYINYGDTIEIKDCMLYLIKK